MRTLVLLLIIGHFFGCGNNQSEDTLLLYCAAGMKPAMEEISNEFLKETGLQVQIQYGGSGTLLSNIRISKKGDLYLAADESYIDEAANYGLIKERYRLAKQTPVIAILKGNPKNITSVEDLEKEDVRVVIANPDAASIGRQTRDILTRAGKYDALNSKVLATFPTVNEVANAIKLGTADAGIIWDATARQYKELDLIIPSEFVNELNYISVGILKSSEHIERALSFIKFAKSEKGRMIIEKLGYELAEPDI